MNKANYPGIVSLSVKHMVHHSLGNLAPIDESYYWYDFAIPCSQVNDTRIPVYEAKIAWIDVAASHDVSFQESNSVS